MQLGELQNQIERFKRRNTQIVALSVDRPSDSTAMIERMGLTFLVGSDPDQAVVKAFKVQNPDTQELALHAVYLLGQDGKVFYRKVAGRRPVSNELIDAIDTHLGQYPQNDEAAPRRRVNVAYPTNDFQALLEMVRAEQLPEGVTESDLQPVLSASGDDATIAWTTFARARAANTPALLQTAAWMTRQAFIANKPEALRLGALLDRRIARVNELENAVGKASPGERDDLLQQLSRARAGLTLTQTEIGKQAAGWQLRFAKTSLRSRREVALAASRG